MINTLFIPLTCTAGYFNAFKFYELAENSLSYELKDKRKSIVINQKRYTKLFFVHEEILRFVMKFVQVY